MGYRSKRKDGQREKEREKDLRPRKIIYIVFTLCPLRLPSINGKEKRIQSNRALQSNQLDESYVGMKYFN